MAAALNQQRQLHQWFTPRWAAEELVNQFFQLTPDDLVLEPSCGDGSFLQAVPDEVPAIGVEIDPLLAQHAADFTGRPVITGYFRTVTIEAKPTLIIGNPPFDMKVFDGFLDRAAQLLPESGRCGFLLPAYSLQTPRRVLRWSETWGIRQSLIPRTLFPRLRLPLVFVMFSRGDPGDLHGFSLYREAEGVRVMAGWCRAIMISGARRTRTWRAIVEEALHRLGGQATLTQIYDEIEPRRPASNRFWQEKVRQTLQRHCDRIDRGVWRAAA